MVGFKKWWLKFTDKFGFSVIHPQYLSRRHMLWFIKKTQKYAKGKLIDIGCGTKLYQKYYPKVDSYTGLDHPTTAKKYPADSAPDIFGDILNLPLKNSSYDTVLLFEVLEHVSNPEKAVGEVQRILKPGGYLLLTAPFIYPLHDIPYDYLRFTRFYLENLLEENKFKVVKIFSAGTFSDFLWQTVILFFLFKFREKPVYLLTLPVFIPFYLAVNLFFLIFCPAKENKNLNLFSSGFFAVARKSDSSPQ